MLPESVNACMNEVSLIISNSALMILKENLGGTSPISFRDITKFSGH